MRRLVRKFLHLPGDRLAAWLFRPWIIAAAIIGSAVFAGVWLWIAFSGPRMARQPHLRTYEAALPPMPNGAIPVEADPLWTLESAWEKRVRVKDGRIYYGYYCAFCHGRDGKGEGPVGVSFIPYPADLTSQRIQALSDTALIRVMMSGVGHEPLLKPVVAPQHRPAIAAFIRTLGRTRE